MMDYQKAIKNHINECRHRVDVIRNHMNTNGDADTDRCLENIQVLETAISAMEELQMYKDGKLCLIPESVYSKQCAELDAYNQLGTLEEVGEAMEKQEKEISREQYHCDDCLHLINRTKGPRGSISGICELRNWRGRRAGRTVACKKFKKGVE